MRLLLDTHAVLWWFLDDPALSSKARAAIGADDAEVWVSAVSAIEIANKFRLGKLSHAAGLAAAFEIEVANEGFGQLPIGFAHASKASQLAFAHKDPFDRLMIAQAICEDMALVSNERLFDQTGVRRLW